jgi:WhiB family redox-sensing transcriptional regulator
MPHPDWWADAACRDHPKDLFFPPPGTPSSSYAQARAICSSCSVRHECLVVALHYEARPDVPYRYGMWGGYTPRERDRLAESRRWWRVRSIRRAMA